MLMNFHEVPPEQALSSTALGNDIIPAMAILDWEPQNMKFGRFFEKIVDHPPSPNLSEFENS